MPSNIDFSTKASHEREGRFSLYRNQAEANPNDLELARTSYLYDRIHEPDLTTDEFREWCYRAENHHPNAPPPTDLAWLVTDEGVAAMLWYDAWWGGYVDRPKTSLRGEPRFLAHKLMTQDPEQSVSLLDIVKSNHAQAVQLLTEKDISVVNPGESYADRKRRRNVERMANARAHRRTPAKVVFELPPEIRVELDNLENSLAALKSEAKVVDAHHAEESARLYREMLVVAGERKRLAAEYKERIDGMLEKVKQLTAKQ